MFLKLDRIEKGLRSVDVLAYFVDTAGRSDSVNVEKTFLTRIGNDDYIPVGLIQRDYSGNAVLVELPQESMSGNWRLWVSMTSIEESSKKGAVA